MEDITLFKKVRLQMGISQEELADRMDVVRGTLVNLESGKTKVVTESVLAFCQVTGVPLLEVIQSCYPDYCGNLLHEDAHYKELLKQTVDEYESRLAAKKAELEHLEEKFTLLSETSRAQQKLIEAYERPSAKKD